MVLLMYISSAGLLAWKQENGLYITGKVNIAKSNAYFSILRILDVVILNLSDQYNSPWARNKFRRSFSPGAITMKPSERGRADKPQPRNFLCHFLPIENLSSNS